jgi:quinol monooxygenase YgiN
MRLVRAAGVLLLLSIVYPAAAQQPVRSYLIYVVNLDVAPADFDKFMVATRDNAEASLKDEGCHEFNLGISNDDPHHVLFFEVYDNADALVHHQQTDHYKKYMAATKDMVLKRTTTQLRSVPLNFNSTSK